MEQPIVRSKYVVPMNISITLIAGFIILNLMRLFGDDYGQSSGYGF